MYDEIMRWQKKVELLTFMKMSIFKVYLMSDILLQRREISDCRGIRREKLIKRQILFN